MIVFSTISSREDVSTVSSVTDSRITGDVMVKNNATSGESITTPEIPRTIFIDENDPRGPRFVSASIIQRNYRAYKSNNDLMSSVKQAAIMKQTQ